MVLKPLRDCFFFTFLDDDAGGRFVNKTKSGILLTNQNIENQHEPRWGKVTAIGPDVTDFAVGETVLIEPLKWTMRIVLDDQKFWKSEQQYVIAVTDAPPEELYL